MKKLLSLPPHLVKSFNELEQKDKNEWFCASDPINKRVGSGGGTAWLLKECYEKEKTPLSFSEWLGKEQKIIIHAGGQSRRLPAYAPVGKILTPIPIFRWERGQQLDQTLLDIQMPLYEKIYQKAPKKLNTLIASGDVYIRSDALNINIPEVDVVCFSQWVEPTLAANHGVFVCKKTQPEVLQYMLQKPEVSELQKLSQEHIFMMDIGIWLLSEKAVKILMEDSGYGNFDQTLTVPQDPDFYDLYSEFGLALGEKATRKDDLVNKLRVAIVPLPNGEFYHYGTSRELISSTLAVQNRVVDQRSILHRDRKPHPSIFTQNAIVETPLRIDQRNLWVENAYIGKNWQIDSDHVFTGIPENNWALNCKSGICLDIVPIGEEAYCIRPYGFKDPSRGAIGRDTTKWMGNALHDWLEKRALKITDIHPDRETDIQSAPLFPVVNQKKLTGEFISWLIDEKGSHQFSSFWKQVKRISADEIMNCANLERIYAQRKKIRLENIGALYKNYERSIFFQSDLDYLAFQVAKNDIQLPEIVMPETDRFTRLHQQMFQSRVKQYNNLASTIEEKNAFEILRDSMLNSVVNEKATPRLSVFRDQIVWGRSPVRIDLAGGWSDTAPSCILNGGAVVNMAVELNGQPPLQVYIKPSKAYKIILRSIDIGSREDIDTYDELRQYNRVGSAFSIPKAALCLAGFSPEFSGLKYTTLKDQLKDFGSGIEISTLAAIPKGSGMGTSSILAATVLGTLSDFCGFGWSTSEISYRTLVLEQLLTTGGGWQDQYGGVLPGVKLLETEKGFSQKPTIKWTTDYLFTNPEHKACMLLYYTGITRTAKNILAEIVKGMFLNAKETVSIVSDIKNHAYTTFDYLQKNDFNQLCDCIQTTWNQKQRIDAGVNPPAVQHIFDQIKDYTRAVKLPGAGGGGYCYIIAKDPTAAAKIQRILNNNPVNESSRFIHFDVSKKGLQVTRS